MQIQKNNRPLVPTFGVSEAKAGTLVEGFDNGQLYLVTQGRCGGSKYLWNLKTGSFVEYGRAQSLRLCYFSGTATLQNDPITY